jgi:hypothetical protein
VSAADKLKALEAENVLDWPVSTAERTRIVLDALPQIRKLVRILECRHSDPDNSGQCIKCQAILDEGQPWDEALAALDAKLGEQA